MAEITKNGRLCMFEITGVREDDALRIETYSSSTGTVIGG